MAHSMTQPTWVTSKDESRELMAIWPDIVRDLTEVSEHLDIPNISKWISKVRYHRLKNYTSEKMRLFK